MKNQIILRNKERFINFKDIVKVVMPRKDSSKGVRIEDIASLCFKNPDKLFYTTLTYEGVDYRCGAEFNKERQKIVLTIDVAPKGYHTEGVLFSGYDETEFGLNLAYRMMKEKNLVLSYSGSHMTYDRTIDMSQKQSSDMPNKLKSFVEDVVRTATEVDKTILEYIHSAPKKLPREFKKYLSRAI